MADKVDLDALEALYAKATLGAWSWEDSPATIYAARSPDRHGLNLFGRLDPDVNGSRNLDCIIALHNAFPALLAELREARGRKCETCRHTGHCGIQNATLGVCEPFYCSEWIRA